MSSNEESGRRPQYRGELQRCPCQANVAKWYMSDPIQIGVAVLIGLNFATNIVEKEVDPSGTIHADLFKKIGLFYNIAFLIELIVNLYAHWFREFWNSGWNIFDVIVVGIGVINMVEIEGMPKAFSLLRMARAFRVFRLFARVKSLNKILVAIFHAIPGVCNAFLILFIVMCIYAILAVEFFKDVGYADDDHGCAPAWGYETRRDRGCMGREYFGTFTKSLYTMFQVMTGESWSEIVARPAIWYWTHFHQQVGAAMFFVSFVLITAFVLANVVVAVLLDKMVEPETAAAEAEKVADIGLTEAQLEASKRLQGCQGRLAHLETKSSEHQEAFQRAQEDMVQCKELLGSILKIMQQKEAGKARL